MTKETVINRVIHIDHSILNNRLIILINKIKDLDNKIEIVLQRTDLNSKDIKNKSEIVKIHYIYYFIFIVGIIFVMTITVKNNLIYANF